MKTWKLFWKNVKATDDENSIKEMPYIGASWFVKHSNLTLHVVDNSFQW